MRAPTTPSGTPVHEPEERACPSCGAANGLIAAFCWRCYRPFGAGVPQPATAGGPRSGARPWGPEPAVLAPPTPNRRVGSTVTVVLVTLVAFAGGYWFVNRDTAVAVPERFGDVTLIEDEQTRIVVDMFRTQVERSGIEGEMTLYGDGTPTAALIWIRDASVPTTDAAFDEFATGFDAGIGSEGSLDVTRTTNEVVGGVTFICAPVVSVAPGTICMWQDDDVFWLLFDFSGQPPGAGRDLAVLASDAISA